MKSRTEEARNLKFQIKEKDRMYYSEHKGADQLCSLILSLGLKTGFEVPISPRVYPWVLPGLGFKPYFEKVGT